MQIPNIYLIGIISAVPKNVYADVLRQIVIPVIIQCTSMLENGIIIHSPTGTIECKGTIHCLLGDHMGQCALTGIQDPKCNHGSMYAYQYL